MPPFRKLAEREIFRGGLISVGAGTFEAADGERFEREIVHHPGAVVVVPVHDGGDVTLIRQYRTATGVELLEIPAGKRDVDGEEPATTAARELVEEVALRPGHLELLGRFYNSPGFSDELSWCYLATDLEEVDGDLQGIEEQNMTVERMPLDAAWALVAEGGIVDAKTIVGLSLARDRVG